MQNLNPQPNNHVMHAIYTTFAAIPWVWLGLFALFVGIEGGTWMQVPIYLALMISLGSVPVWLAVIAWRHSAIPARRERHLTLLAYIVGIGLMLSILVFDPFGAFTALVD